MIINNYMEKEKMSTDAGIIVDERIDIGILIKEPSLYKLIFLNDDTTPMDFVVAIIIKFFNKSEQEAFDLTMKVHNEGSAVVVVLPYEIAESKANSTMEIAERNGFGLRIKLEPDD